MKGRHVELDTSPIGICPRCGKQSFLTRKAAKRWARTRLPGEHFNEYRCGDYWHFGHLPTEVLDGNLDRRNLPTKREPHR